MVLKKSPFQKAVGIKPEFDSKIWQQAAKQFS
jgi:hypothetical protein